MSLKFGYKALSLAVISTLTATAAHAAGLDRSGQDITAFLQEGTYAETVYTYIDADVTGKDTLGRDTGDAAEAYDFFRYGVKADINDTFSVGVLYDEPFGAAVQYEGNSNFVAQNADATIRGLTDGRVPALEAGQQNLAQLQEGFAALQNLSKGAAAAVEQGDLARAQQLKEQADVVAANLMGATNTNSIEAATATATALGTALKAAQVTQALEGQGTNVEIRTNNLTMLVGAKLGANKNFQIYGGPVAQRVKGEVHLRGPAYQVMTGYDAKIATDTEVGWAAGLAFYKPEIALKAALTYRSEIEHDSEITETIPVTGYQGTKDFKVTLPESWNLDFQTGVNPTTLLTAKVRYVPWSDFDIRPTQYTETTKLRYPQGLPIVSYDKDQWSAEVGLGKRVTDRLAVSGAVGWDSGAGNPTSTLGPIKGYYSLGLGARYNFTPEWSLSLGGKYFKFGDADARIPPQVVDNAGTSGRFEDNDGYAVGVKLAYHAK
ncbi:outer membrane protein transport protein [Moraxella catarrhalis]|uniref:Outer membrane protein E n=1 Tax=Moraxella catarrhalis TaxID=480 RepID=A0A198UE97_MORCA|nr:outer membrane protein transport protein [Moraxella catarrhalis]OAU94291.1 Outer membrane protein E [Moraxella catarrhalis]OAU94741.1 Outer membrane protein E [Moraxella catarrhalis]OAV04117.1 Outer membrane protein E [Moraxella catarrhalis]